MEIATLPSEVELVAVYVANQLVPLPLTVADCPAIVTKGAVIDSEAVMETVITSPTLALFVVELLDAIDTKLNVGGKSIETEPTDKVRD